MREEPRFIISGGRRLFAVVHDAAGDTAGGGRGPGAVLVHPFAEEKVIAQRAYVLLARGLAEHGVSVLRFDLSGHGDSEGEFEEATLERWLEDIRTAVRTLKEDLRSTRIALVGMRFGGTLAALAADDAGLVDDLALVSPILTGAPYMDQCLRSNLTTQMAAYKKIVRDRQQLAEDLLGGTPVNVDGYLLGSELYRGIAGIDLIAAQPPRVARALLLSLKGVDAATAGAAAALLEAWTAAGIAGERREVVDEPPWKDPKVYGIGGMVLRETLITWVGGAPAN